MASVWYRCRKCRAYLFSDEHLLSVNTQKLGQEAIQTSSSELTCHREEGKPIDHVPDEERHQTPDNVSCAVQTLYFIKLDGCPAWIKKLIQKGQFLKGKLNCPQCSGRVGLFDFFCKSLCECGKHTVHPIHIVKSRIDESWSQTAKVRRPKIPRAQRPEFQVIKTMEEAGLLHEYKPCNQTTISESGGLCLSEAQSTSEQPRQTPESPSKSFKYSSKSSPERRPKIEPAGTFNQTADTVERNTNETSNLFAPLEVQESASSEKSVPEPDLLKPADEYTCPICLDVFYHPYSIKPCEHVFCGPCLRRLAGTKTQSTKCPLCRKAISLCIPNSDMTKRVLEKYPQDWRLRHRMEFKVRKKLPDLPCSASYKRKAKQKASAMLSQSAGVIFVALFAMLLIAFLMTLTSYIVWKLFEQYGEEIVFFISSFQRVVDGSWNLFLIFLFEKRISQETCQTVLEALTDLSHSVGKIYNNTRN